MAHNSTSIQTATGRMVDLARPDPDQIDIYDIAHALSRLCRFTGHTKRFYSVAEHSIYVAMLVPDHLKLAALLHDATEAYLGDVSTPLKSMLPEYKRIEREWYEAICRRFSLPLGESSEIKQADRMILALEHKHVMEPGHEWEVDADLKQTPRDARKWIADAMYQRQFYGVWDWIEGDYLEAIEELMPLKA